MSIFPWGNKFDGSQAGGMFVWEEGMSCDMIRDVCCQRDVRVMCHGEDILFAVFALCHLEELFVFCNILHIMSSLPFDAFLLTYLSSCVSLSLDCFPNWEHKK